jgi:hypothetical protein
MFEQYESHQHLSLYLGGGSEQVTGGKKGETVPLKGLSAHFHSFTSLGQAFSGGRFRCSI